MRSSPPRGRGGAHLYRHAQAHAPENLIRFVLGPDHAVVPDLKRKLPGRGVWVGLSKTLVAQAVRNSFFRAGLRDKAFASAICPI